MKRDDEMKKNINHSPILLSQPTFVAPMVQAEKAEKEAAKALAKREAEADARLAAARQAARKRGRVSER